MRRLPAAAAAALFAATAACARPAPPAGPATGMAAGRCARHRGDLPALLGKTEAELRAAFTAMSASAPSASVAAAPR